LPPARDEYFFASVVKRHDNLRQGCDFHDLTECSFICEGDGSNDKRVCPSLDQFARGRRGPYAASNLNRCLCRVDDPPDDVEIVALAEGSVQVYDVNSAYSCSRPRLS